MVRFPAKREPSTTVKHLNMKKTKPSSKPAAPQVKPVTKPVTKAAAAKKKTAASPAPAIKKTTATPKKVVAVKKTTAPKKVAQTTKPVPAATWISAKIDIGFGNSLSIRGEGPGLSWDSGTPLTSAGADLWTVAIVGATAPVVFKLLVNDLTWSVGEDYVVPAGQTVEIVPSF